MPPLVPLYYFELREDPLKNQMSGFSMVKMARGSYYIEKYEWLVWDGHHHVPSLWQSPRLMYYSIFRTM